MIIGLRRSIGILLLLAVVLPSFGPLADHHFAERQAIHRHVDSGRSGPHSHDYRQADHPHDAEPGLQRDAPTALYSFESGLVLYFVLADAPSTLSALHPELAGPVVPAPHDRLTSTTYPSPSEPPPRHSA